MVRKIRAKLVLQLRAEGLSGRAIAASQGMSRKSITAVLETADAAGVVWDEIADSSDREVYARLLGLSDKRCVGSGWFSFEPAGEGNSERV
ncbi:hypothetical protein [Arthrobacter sp. Z4-13]